MALRSSALVQLKRPLPALLETRATITVPVSELHLRLSTPLVHVLLQLAHHLGFRRGGWRSAERAAHVVLPALVGALRANKLAAASKESGLEDWKPIEADVARAAPVLRIGVRPSGRNLCRRFRPSSR